MLLQIKSSTLKNLDKQPYTFQDINYYKTEELKNIQETNRDIAFCAHTILQSELMEVSDLTKDYRFAENPFVTQRIQINSTKSYPIFIVVATDISERRMGEPPLLI